MKIKLLLLVAFIALSNSVHAQRVTTADTAKGKGGALSLGPLLMYFNLDRGQSNQKILNIVNNKDHSYKFNLQVRNFYRDTIGRVLFTDSITEHSGANWVTIDKNYLEVGAGEHAKILVSVNVPDDEEAVKEMKWALVTASTFADQNTSTKGNLKAIVNKEITSALQIFITPPNLSKDIKITGFSKLSDTSYRITCNNPGQMMLKCKFIVELTSPELTEKKTIEVDEKSILPDETMYIDMRLPKDLKKGTYNAIALIDAEDDDVPIEAAQMQITVD